MFKSWITGRHVEKQRDAKALYGVNDAKLGPDKVVYAIGDIHGMSVLALQLVQILLDDIERQAMPATIVVLGDMIDRGPDSRSVLDLFLNLEEKTHIPVKVTLLKGNHEQMMLDFMADPEQHGPFWLRNGGGVTLMSYGLHPPSQLQNKQWVYIRDEFLQRLPPQHFDCFKQLLSKFIMGDYFFCHASVKAGQALSEQKDEDLLWSRSFPLDNGGSVEKIIVHGHQPVVEPEMAKFHINIDTGAYATGRLTALRLHDSNRKFITVKAQKKALPNKDDE